MSKGPKQVAFNVPQSKLAPGADQWISNRGAETSGDREGGNVTTLRTPEPAAPEATAAAPAPERMARFTFDVPESLHRRVKTECAARGVRMADVMRGILEREFPVS
jgi:hypothetical protein